MPERRQFRPDSKTGLWSVLPSCLRPISTSSDLKSSETFVLTSPPILSPAHCLNLPNFLLTFMLLNDAKLIVKPRASRSNFGV